MTEIKGVIIEEPWRFDTLLPIFKDAYHALVFAYNSVHKVRLNYPFKKPDNANKWFLEDLITDDLIKNEEHLPKSFNYRIVNQQKDATNNTRIDIAIQWSLIFGQSYDIKVECKLLNKSNLDYIINGGIKRFKKNEYAEKLPFAGMLFYNTKDTINMNINLLNNKIERILSREEQLNKMDFLDNFDDTYISTHSRVSNSDIDLYSMIFNFNDVIFN